ncbi:hypothetical protein F5887DRAFT_1259561 [Amanita rubescens]|nr:hypothetical protein F5887DRAFT_1259561 [Amanita rubescens]
MTSAHSLEHVGVSDRCGRGLGLLLVVRGAKHVAISDHMRRIVGWIAFTQVFGVRETPVASAIPKTCGQPHEGAVRASATQDEPPVLLQVTANSTPKPAQPHDPETVIQTSTTATRTMDPDGLLSPIDGPFSNISGGSQQEVQPDTQPWGGKWSPSTLRNLCIKNPNGIREQFGTYWKSIEGTAEHTRFIHESNARALKTKKQLSRESSEIVSYDYLGLSGQLCGVALFDGNKIWRYLRPYPTTDFPLGA